MPQRLHRRPCAKSRRIPIRSFASACWGCWCGEKDGVAQKKLLEGLKNPDKALVPPEKALQLLGYDVHAEPTRSRATSCSKPPNEAAPSARPCACSPRTPPSAPLFEKLLRDKDELREIRQIVGLGAARAATAKLQTHARDILLDESDYDDIQATSLSALTQFGDEEAVGDDTALMKSVDRFSTGKRRRSTSRAPQQFLSKYGR